MVKCANCSAIFMIAFFILMTQGVLLNTLAALGYFIISLVAQPKFYSYSYPISFETMQYSIVVSTNDTITDLAEKLYGSKDYWTNLWLDNPQIKDPNVLPNGSTIRVKVEHPLLVAKIPSETLAAVLNRSYERTYPEDKINFSAQVKPTSAPIAATVSTPTPTNPGNFDAVYKEAGAKYGVPWQVLYGIHLTETGLRDGAISNAQGSGAQGPMQFMPGTWRAYGVDGNGDGVADINNATDAIYGAANYLAKHGGVMAGLQSYGGNTRGTLAAARERGYTE